MLSSNIEQPTLGRPRLTIVSIGSGGKRYFHLYVSRSFWRFKEAEPRNFVGVLVGTHAPWAASVCDLTLAGCSVEIASIFSGLCGVGADDIIYNI